MNQQRDIEALEVQKDSLVKSNKAVKKTIWDWKQQLYAEASVENAVVSLSNLKAIYGEAPTLQSGPLSLYVCVNRCYSFWIGLIFYFNLVKMEECSNILILLS